MDDQTPRRSAAAATHSGHALRWCRGEFGDCGLSRSLLRQLQLQQLLITTGVQCARRAAVG